ncbi:MAG: GxxExxY protein [Alphaproteobacteria bacterium]|nr:GxxExxY protein [Alphaproteobacteria bacterium]
MEIEALVRHCVDRGYRLHCDLGPGLLESAYEMILFEGLRRDGIAVSRQQSVAIRHEDIVIEQGFRYDLLVEDKLLIEIKSTDRHAPVYAKQVLTYLRLMDLRIGLLMNFGMGTFKEGCTRLVNNYRGSE